MKKVIISAMCTLIILAIAGCGSNHMENGMQDGMYTAQMSEYSFGWKEYVTINVRNGIIVSTEYDAENASGMIKSWDNDYMTTMKATDGTYPNEYTRYYASQLTGAREVPEIDALSGATSSGKNFEKLSAAVIGQAKKGDMTIALVEPEKHE